ncbi:MAG: glycosyltransferase family 2 protein [Desulfuromonadales bacterium]
MAVCVLIPAYNAALTLGNVLADVLLQGLPVVVVDDGSSDATSRVAAGYGVTLLSHPMNRGKGAALMTGFRWARENGFEGVITLDADGQHDPGFIGLLAASAIDGQFGILIASRYSQFVEMAGLRKIWNRFGVWCLRKRTGFEISDSQSGFRFYSASLLSSVSLFKSGYDLEMEILMKAWQNGFTIGSLPVPARIADGRLTSHYRPVRDTWNICMTFLRYM